MKHRFLKATLLTVTAGVVTALVLGAPDIKRYLAIRAM
jgi:hypothetical protein